MSHGSASEESPEASCAGRLTGLNHIGIAVHAIEDVLALYTDGLGATVESRLALDDRGLDVCFVRLGETQLELLAPTRPGTAIEKFLATRGPGVHHLAFSVPDVQRGLEHLRDCGIRLIDETPKPGAHGAVAFAHPSSTHGVLIELCGPSRSR